MTRVAALGVSLVVLTLAALAVGLHLRGIGADPLTDGWFRGLIAVSVPIYFAAIAGVLRGARPSLAMILVVAAILRVALVIAPPLLSSDVYRYVWDGRVQDAGINPYLHIPADPALAALRDTAIYPHINRANYAPTIYPPAAQALFAAIASISPSVMAMKAAMVAMEVLVVTCLLRLLRRCGKADANILIYAWNPLAIWEFAGNGHVDAAAAGFLLLAIFLRCGWARDGWAGAALGLAVLIKFLPAIAAPALWRRGTPGWRLGAGGFVTVVALYAVYALFGQAGAKVLGFLGAYGGEEGLDTGAGIWALAGMAHLVALPGWAAQVYLAISACLLLALGAWIAFRPRPPIGTGPDIIRVCGDTAVLAACGMVAISPHYSWYFVWLAAPAVITPYLSVIWLSAASILLYANSLPDHFVFQSLVFAPALLLAWFDLKGAGAMHPRPALQGGH